MKKWIYKLIFSIAIVPLIFVMLPKKEVKAQQQEEFAPILVKATWVDTYFDVEWDSYYEFVVTYKLDNIFIHSLNRFEYIFVTGRYFDMRHDIFSRATGSYQIEGIQIEGNTTKFYVRMVLSKSRINQYYGGPYDALDLFVYESGFYVWVMYDDIAGQAYNDGYDDGYQEGHNDGFWEGYDDGYIDGYRLGYGDGYDEGEFDGKREGYDEGYLDGRDDGYSNGYDVGRMIGYDEGRTFGYNQGYQEGYDEGYQEGEEDGMDIGRQYWYDVGYNAGFNDGTKETVQFSHLLKTTFVGIGSLLVIELLPGISIGALIAVPIVFGIIAFIIGKRRD